MPLLLATPLIFAFSGYQTVSAGHRTVNVGVYENEPKVFTSASGKSSGIFIDIIEHVARGEGWELNYIPGTWAEGLSRLERGEIDLMPDVAYTADRDERFSFHKVPVLSSWSQVYARKESGINSILDLNGKRIAVLEGSVQQGAFVQLTGSFGLDVRLVPAPDFKTMFEMVSAGTADAAVSNRFYGLMHARNQGLEETAVVFDPSDLFFATSKGDSCRLLETIDKYLLEMKRDHQSEYYASLRRWTSEEVKFETPAWLRITGLVAGIALLFSLVGSIVLKRQVDVRTRELREINREMERRIAERTEELSAAMKKAQAADHIKSAFLATMSHELRTPLNSIIGFTGILLQGLAGPLNEEQDKQLTMVQNSARHLLSLINDVLDISKIEAGQLALAVTTFDVRPSLEKMIKLIAPLAEKKGLDLQLEIGTDVGRITTDQRRLEQIVLNLLGNAVKFTEQGYVRLTCWVEEGDCVFSVSDTGIGIREDDISNIFKPFVQLDGGFTRKHEGSGLGLSICSKLVSMMRGTITVESRWEKGSTFSVRLPNRQEVSREQHAVNH